MEAEPLNLPPTPEQWDAARARIAALEDVLGAVRRRADAQRERAELAERRVAELEREIDKLERALEREIDQADMVRREKLCCRCDVRDGSRRVVRGTFTPRYCDSCWAGICPRLVRCRVGSDTLYLPCVLRAGHDGECETAMANWEEKT